MLDIQFEPFPVIFLENVTLRKVTMADENEIFLLRSNREVMKFIDRPLATSVEDARQLINAYDSILAKNEGINWAITLKESPSLIGVICLWKIQKEHHRAEIGYMLSPTYKGRGLTNEALKAVVDYGFKTLKLHSIEAVVNPENIASMQLLGKAGFTREAYFRENYYFDGQFLDTAVFSLLTKEVSS